MSDPGERGSAASPSPMGDSSDRGSAAPPAIVAASPVLALGADDAGYADFLLRELEPGTAPPSGGSEDQYHRDRYRYAVSKLLERVVPEIDLTDVLVNQRLAEVRQLPDWSASAILQMRASSLSRDEAEEVARLVRQ